MIRRLRARRDRDESGFTLAELIVYSILMIVVLGLAASLFIRLINEQRDIKAMAEANNETQLLFEKMEMDLRNADWAEIDSSGNLLVMRTKVATSTTTNTIYCVGYYYDSTNNQVHRIRTTQNTPTKSALDATSASSLHTIASAWPVALDDAGKIDSERVFGPRDALFEYPEFIEIAVSANTIDNRKPVEFHKSVSLRTQNGMGTGCR